MQTALSRTRAYFAMIKFEHSVFALPFAYLGLFLAENGWPRPPLFFWVTLAMVSFRSMAMGANRLIDCEIDRLNPRTKGRALVTGELSKSWVWVLTAVFLAIFLLSASRLNFLCLILSPVPIFFAWLYPWMKRFSWFSHAVLGMTLAVAPYGAWLASRGEFSWIPFFLSAGVAAWVAGFDILYSFQDLDFDRAQSLHSFPAAFGMQAGLRLTQVLHALSILFWSIAGIMGGLGYYYFLGLTLGAFFLFRQHALLRQFNLKKIEEAFFVMNAWVSLILFAATVLDLAAGRRGG